ncbi:Pyruvate/Phosphoenolpyruvate kinase-like domain-containing protein [Infundibulicybe gibba]|nr:Pyruvate/Phosphoenolpyruvate kinase-like domain-containing protein [Infundibulicybe gibba]
MFVQTRISLLQAQRRYMSVRPSAEHNAIPPRKKVTLQALQNLRSTGTPITMLTAYDYPTARACSSDPLIDITLVGDSLAQVCLGYASTTQLTLSDMIHHAAAVRRGTTTRFLYPVMGHVGLLPQRHAAMSGYKVQGRSAAGAKAVLDDALALQEAGAFSVVVEAVPKELGQYITEALTVPTIGLVQVLVWDDVIGTWSGHKAKFVRHFGDLRSARADAVHGYAEAVRAEHFRILQAKEWEAFLKEVKA